MTDLAAPLPAAAPAPAPAPTPTPRKGLTFTDDGCRIDVRVGALLVVAAVFLWLWLGSTMSSRVYLVGLPFLLWGVPWQAMQARTLGRPGFPWKVGLAFTVLGAAMSYDLRYRELPGGPVKVQEVGPLLLVAGVWIMAWWPVAFFARRKDDA